MKTYEVVSDITWSGGGILSLDPPEPKCDYALVEANTKREAIIKAVRDWLQDKTSITYYLCGEKCPFSGVKATELYRLNNKGAKED